MVRFVKCLVGAFAFSALLSTAEANPKNFVFAYLMVEDDPRYLKKRRYTGPVSYTHLTLPTILLV